MNQHHRRVHRVITSNEAEGIKTEHEYRDPTSRYRDISDEVQALSKLGHKVKPNSLM